MIRRLEIQRRGAGAPRDQVKSRKFVGSMAVVAAVFDRLQSCGIMSPSTTWLAVVSRNRPVTKTRLAVTHMTNSSSIGVVDLVDLSASRALIGVAPRLAARASP